MPNRFCGQNSLIHPRYMGPNTENQLCSKIALTGVTRIALTGVTSKVLTGVTIIALPGVTRIALTGVTRE